MYRAIVACGLAAGLLLLGRAPLQAATQAAPDTVYAWMNGTVIPGSTVLWDLSSKVFDDDGKPDPSRLTPAEWARVAEAAESIRGTAQQMAAARTIIAAPDGVKLQNEGVEGGSTAAEVQRHIERDREGFNTFARELGAKAAAFVEAARTKDAQRLGDASDSLEGVCEACHSQFWYPQIATQSR